MGPSENRTGPREKQAGAAEAIRTPAAGAAVSAQRLRGDAFIPGRRASAIAARTAGRRRGSGRVGRPSRRYRETAAGQGRNATGKAGVTGSAQEAGKQRDPEAVNEAARVITPEHFFRPFAATGRAATSDSRASGEVPCSVFVRTPAGTRWSGSEERERRWKQARDLIRRY